MIVFPNCKINLGLRILSKRSDGYHNIESIFYPVKWYDVLEIIPSEKEKFNFYGLPISCSLEENLCFRAYCLLKKKYGIKPVKLCLLKNIPTGAGLGGGSSDAAFTLLCLNKIFNLNICDDVLAELALALGSDCLFFLKNSPTYITGKGETCIDINISLKEFFIILVKPNIDISTSIAYRWVVPFQRTDTINIISEKNIYQWTDILENDFEKPVFEKYPIIKSIKEIMMKNGAIYASLTGSGSAVYGIFRRKVDLKSEFNNMIYRSGWLL